MQQWQSSRVQTIYNTFISMALKLIYPWQQVFEHVPVQPRDAREASDVFYKQKTGDALLTYENEVIVTNESMAPSKRLPYVVPQYNISVRVFGLQCWPAGTSSTCICGCSSPGGWS